MKLPFREYIKELGYNPEKVKELDPSAYEKYEQLYRKSKEALDFEQNYLDSMEDKFKSILSRITLEKEMGNKINYLLKESLEYLNEENSEEIDLIKERANKILETLKQSMQSAGSSLILLADKGKYSDQTKDFVRKLSSRFHQNVANPLMQFTVDDPDFI